MVSILGKGAEVPNLQSVERYCFAALALKVQQCKVRNVGHIIDCTEMFIETPKDPKVKAATWSDYKHHHTLKVLVSIMPCGSFNFITEAGW